MEGRIAAPEHGQGPHHHRRFPPIPLGLYIALLAHYQVNAHLDRDQWGDVHVLVENNGHFRNWSVLWTLHGDNRVFFPNLIVVALSHTVRFNIEIEEYLSALMLFGATRPADLGAQAAITGNAAA